MNFFDLLLLTSLFYCMGCDVAKSQKQHHSDIKLPFDKKKIIDKILKTKRNQIPGFENHIEKATEVITKMLDQNIEKRVKEAQKDLEALLISSLDKRILVAASDLHKNKDDCYDVFDNCDALKSSGVCKTSEEAMKKSCRKTCGLCETEAPDLTLKADNYLSTDKSLNKTSAALKKFKTQKKPVPMKEVKKSKKSKKKSKPVKKKQNKKPSKKNKKNKNDKKKSSPKPKPTTKNRHRVDKSSCPDICKTNCLKGCPSNCCTNQNVQVSKPDIPQTKEGCPAECQKTCTKGCSEQCCYQNFLNEMSKNVPNSPFLNPVANSNADIYRQQNPLVNSQTNDYMAYGGSCGETCPRSCYPACDINCCNPLNYAEENYVNVFTKALDATAANFMPYTASPLVIEQVVPQGSQPINLVQDSNNIQLKSDISRTTQLPDDSDIPTDYQRNSSTKQVEACPATCSEICLENCPKRCCINIIEEFPSEPLSDNNISENICEKDCIHHCTPKCLYNHCCQDL